MTELRIGDLDAPGYTLTDVIDLTVGSDGAMYVAQWRVSAVHVFDSSGRFVQAIGRAGGGPGEFSQPVNVGWVGDTLWVVDMPIGRIHLFEQSGKFLSSFNLVSPPISDHYSGLAPVALLADGSVISKPLVDADLISRGFATSTPLFRSGRSVEQLDTLAWLSAGSTTLEIRFGEEGALYTRQPISDSELYDAYPAGSGLILVERFAAQAPEPSHFRVTKLDTDGDTIFSTTYAYTPVRVTAGFADSLVDSLANNLVTLRRRGIPAGLREKAVREALYLPDFHPPVKSLVAGRDGTIWLERGIAHGDSVLWSVLDENGHEIAAVSLPAGVRLFQAERGSVWGVEHDTLGVAYIVRYRVRGN